MVVCSGSPHIRYHMLSAIIGGHIHQAHRIQGRSAVKWMSRCGPPTVKWNYGITGDTRPRSLLLLQAWECQVMAQLLPPTHRPHPYEHHHLFPLPGFPFGAGQLQKRTVLFTPASFRTDCILRVAPAASLPSDYYGCSHGRAVCLPHVYFSSLCVKVNHLVQFWQGRVIFP